MPAAMTDTRTSSGPTSGTSITSTSNALSGSPNRSGRITCAYIRRGTSPGRGRSPISYRSVVTVGTPPAAWFPKGREFEPTRASPASGERHVANTPLAPVRVVALGHEADQVRSGVAEKVVGEEDRLRRSPPRTRRGRLPDRGPVVEARPEDTVLAARPDDLRSHGGAGPVGDPADQVHRHGRVPGRFAEHPDVLGGLVVDPGGAVDVVREVAHRHEHVVDLVELPIREPGPVVAGELDPHRGGDDRAEWVALAHAGPDPPRQRQQPLGPSGRRVDDAGLDVEPERVEPLAA